ncbi:MAG TPA: phosphoribosylaminoimidazolesuccinocarboxamide synthase [Polyangiaceae bacterium]|jgi:phosphoribosylaminoimidazole-succinocarboxamide synthase|nr:phosphoribosylaminoimidazolesuccinocarboxamide synthase [Polyangiaceae bacterium]
MAKATESTIRAALAHPLDHTDFPTLGKKYEGKVRDNYTKEGKRTIVVTDRISAFDRVLGTLPLKGQLLNHVAAWWFEQTKGVAPNHVLEVPDPSVLIAEECTPLPVEMIVRAYLTGSTSTSIWVHYQKGARTFCGHPLPEGMKKHQKLPAPILTPSTKAAHGDHDVSASREEILRLTGMPAAEFDAAAEMAMNLFAFGQRVCKDRGLILVDTKYEFGKTKDGRIVVIDEIHTPDSSRFWFEATYDGRLAEEKDPESFDKEYVRRWLVSEGFSGDGPIPKIPDDVRVEATRRYIHAVETITGKPFEANLDDPLPRIRKALSIA